MNIRRHLLVGASAVAVALGLYGASAVKAEVVVRGVEGKPLEEVRPAPAFFRPDLSVITAQPSPSEVNPSFLGPVLLMKQAQVDLEKGTAKLPLRKGRLRSGETVWFVVTDTTDVGSAVWSRFGNRPKEDTLWYYRELANAFQELLPGQLAEELMEIVIVLENE